VERDETYEAWAPPDGIWTPWAKPVLFAHVDAVQPAAPVVPTWVREELFLLDPGATDYRANARAPLPAVVVDLPGVEGVAAGIALARLGFRPVPLYTAIPGAEALVPMFPVVRALLGSATELRQRRLPANAPPAFLLDSRRAGEGVFVRGGVFDNRSYAFPGDFPSAARLRDAGIGRVILVQTGQPAPREDITATLASWQGAGLPLAVVLADAPDSARPLHVRLPWFGAAIAAWWNRLRLRGDRQHGFGRYVLGGSAQGG
jgi:hypothetical protein